MKQMPLPSELKLKRVIGDNFLHMSFTAEDIMHILYPAENHRITNLPKDIAVLLANLEKQNLLSPSLRNDIHGLPMFIAYKVTATFKSHYESIMENVFYRIDKAHEDKVYKIAVIVLLVAAITLLFCK